MTSNATDTDTATDTATTASSPDPKPRSFRIRFASAQDDPSQRSAWKSTSRSMRPPPCVERRDTIFAPESDVDPELLLADAAAGKEDGGEREFEREFERKTITETETEAPRVVGILKDSSPEANHQRGTDAIDSFPSGDLPAIVEDGPVLRKKNTNDDTSTNEDDDEYEDDDDASLEPTECLRGAEDEDEDEEDHHEPMGRSAWGSREIRSSLRSMRVLVPPVRKPSAGVSLESATTVSREFELAVGEAAEEEGTDQWADGFAGSVSVFSSSKVSTKDRTETETGIEAKRNGRTKRTKRTKKWFSFFS
ncbi:unnamed protein product [Pseudo-nitzschia multistriata]|uniref:Uncharacterized protein n=1 Tax=Pseudo-nitzschia multistriata TaxID=183589 RepID=A0A448ZL20_9STRA|nr:unnamed protein product [Pseudo-nitzschia multistriata]